MARSRSMGNARLFLRFAAASIAGQARYPHRR